METLMFVSGAAAGVAFWSFAEYALHHWCMHLGKGRNHLSRSHLKHHAEKDYFAPNSEKAVAAVAVALVVFPLAILAAGVWAGPGFGLGFVAMYIMYEYVHWAAHYVPPSGPYSRWVRRSHFAHHFTSPKHNHGVTSPIWDLVFGTYRDPGQVRVRERLAMAWLLDESGTVKPEYQADYLLIPSRRSRRTEQADSAQRAVAPMVTCGREAFGQ